MLLSWDFGMTDCGRNPFDAQPHFPDILHDVKQQASGRSITMQLGSLCGPLVQH